MSVNEEIQASTDSFWEIGQYKRTVKRIEDGHKLCSDLMALIKERSEIEDEYSKKLRHWTKKWNKLLDSGPEYGTTQAAWRSALTEADRVADLHTNVRDKLVNDVNPKIKNWQKEHFHKTLTGMKEVKEMEEHFRKAQKPWAKRLDKVVKAKKDFHTACRNEKSTSIQANNALADSSMSEDQKKKIQVKAEQYREQVETTTQKYEAALNDINSYNAKYIEDMTEVFDKCQEMEAERLKFFKEALLDTHKCLDISVDPEFSQLYVDFKNTIDSADYNKDLKFWSNNHGVDMAMNWPSFEEYSPELQSISSKKSKSIKETSGDGGIVVTKISHQKTDSFASNNSDHVQQQRNDYNKGGDNIKDEPMEQAITPPVTRQKSYDETLNPFADDSEDEGSQSDTKGDDASIASSKPEVSSPGPPKPPRQRGQSENNGDNPFGSDDNDGWEGVDTALDDDGRPGVPVRALYDYDGAEEDELTFKAGEEFEKLEDEDEQGWCKGRLRERVGLYPANYVEVIS
ncbi:protein kinase C and casein kinase substrate in neurons protein 1 isoform X2 [Lingula anatina]|uniref:Protein kinase C and casein kinase substrate in neurons protein 1 isoform X2 n=1 Tax=Lingula anatina TaxID=7574 RepID=A0A1S3JH13_LINAN|nr:protein kinase C and casein kinase substrate in neurons protein 1 isoform X2 [Lingula anatina]|eukprot:XP_013409648.1 protein kinase C and casein kinase substrate in neurons protein 1 isoform X2 [Lingula anatina]